MSARLKCEACCPSCGAHFTGVTAFDAHRQDGRCLDPRTVKRLVVKTEAGTCALGSPPSTRVGVAVFQMASSAAVSAGRFAA